MKEQLWIAVASLSGTLAVVFGAFAAHALRARLTAEQLVTWNIAVHYHLVHSVVLLALALYAAASTRSTALPSALFAAGILLFSGSLYGLLLTGQSWLGPLTPLGGFCLVGGWLSLLVLAVREG